MVLVVDIGNTNIVIGVYSNNKLDFSARIATNKEQTYDEYAVILNGIFALYDINIQKIEGIIMSSVVPPLTGCLKTALTMFFDIDILIVGPGIKTGFNIKIDSPAQLGTDMVCNVAGALSKYKGPLIVIDMGTATTITVVSEKGDILGGALSPGLKISLNALSASTAQLPFINLDNVKNIIGKNTIDCMQSGVIYGSASMIDGMITRISEELNQDLTVILTGGMSTIVVKHCKHKIFHEPNLLTDGLYQLYLKNS